MGLYHVRPKYNHRLVNKGCILILLNETKFPLKQNNYGIVCLKTIYLSSGAFKIVNGKKIGDGRGLFLNVRRPRSRNIKDEN